MNLLLFKALNQNNIKNDFVLMLEEMILKGELIPGDRLPAEREFAEHYGVSRPTIHDCIVILENRGLVTLRPRHGVIINNYRSQATLEVLLSLLESKDHELGPGLHKDLEHFRIHMEKDIVSLICKRGPEAAADLDELERINEQLTKTTDPVQLAELDFQFHLQLALSGGNSLYPLLTNTLKPAHTKYLESFYNRATIPGKVIKFHRELIALLKNGKIEASIEKITQIDSYAAYQ